MRKVSHAALTVRLTGVSAVVVPGRPRRQTNPDRSSQTHPAKPTREPPVLKSARCPIVNAFSWSRAG